LLETLNPSLPSRSSALLNLNNFQNLWLDGALSNGEYLLYLNFICNRSFNDLTQYPVFPWVIADYKNEKLELEGGAK